MKQDKAKQIACDEKLVPTDDRVKIEKSNLRIDPSMTQTEETFQVALDILKNVPFYNSFLISAEVLEIYMHPFWFTIEKVKRASYYKFEIDHKTYFIQPPSSNDLKEFLLNLGYTGKLPSISEIRVDHMHQPWRTFRAIINKCLSSKTLRNDRLCPSRTEILWGMYNNANVDYAAIIWEDIQYQIDYQQTKSISKKERSPYHTVDDDGLLDRLKFITKVTQVTKEPAAPKKATASTKKKITKRKLVLKDETDGEKDLEHRTLSRKKRIPKTVVIQEPLSAPVKQTYESSNKHKGIEMLSDAAQFEFDTLKAQKASRRESILQHYPGSSSEGTGSKPGVLDELTGKYAISDEGAGIQSEVPDETKNLNQSESEVSEDDQNKSEDDDERVETDDDRDDDKEEDDRSTYIEETNTKRTYSDVDHQGKGDTDMNIEQKVEKEMSEEKPEGDAQATEAQPNDDNKDKFEFLQPTSSQSLSSGFANQFLLNSPNAFLLATITKPAEAPPPPPPSTPATVTLATQVPNTEAVSSIVQRFFEMEQFVKQLKETDFSLVIHDSITSQVPSIVDKYLRSSLPNAFLKELQANNTTLKKELSEIIYKEVIEESVKAHVVKEFKNFLPQCLPKAVSDFGMPIIEESVKAHAVNENAVSDFAKPMLQKAIAKSLISFAQFSSSHQSATEVAKTLNELELKHISIKLDEGKSTQSTKPDQILKKYERGDDDQDEDPSAGPNQSNETKKRRTRKETKSSKKSSTPTKFTKGEPTSKPSKSGKSRSANDIVKETVFEMGSNDVDQSFEKRRMILNSLLLMLMLNNLLLMLLLI
ncbi:hypothetical protein Tco_1019758 [Tanacetum coccineum]|uniref:Uncharacterized protein n=1 Tax=Tanacetum coccineum TaxID=301880 RepID=A0ABQ5FY43_9ASTR